MESHIDAETGRPAPIRRNRLAAVVVGASVALVIGYFALGMPGMEHDSTAGTDRMPMNEMDHGATGFMALEPEEFAARVDDPANFVVNVHVPYGGAIAGTDAFIAYDRILASGELPTDKDSAVLLYCQTGSMSKTAAEALVAEGYSNVSHLEGGMEAWREDGRPLIADGGGNARADYDASS